MVNGIPNNFLYPFDPLTRRRIIWVTAGAVALELRFKLFSEFLKININTPLIQWLVFIILAYTVIWVRNPSRGI
tara:strand:- start:3714 stop:3935 length:222 start_codon:yes stop_codon:yes gene_type:complete